MEEIDLRQIFKIFLEKKIFIIIITMIFILGGLAYSYIYSKYIFKQEIPKYQSSTTLILSKATGVTTTTNETIIDSNTGEAINLGDIQLNKNLINTYSELIKSKKVLRQVIDKLGLTDTNEAAISQGISVAPVANTEIMKLTVSSTDPELSEKVANAIPPVFGKEIARIYNINNVYVIDKAEVPTSPYNLKTNDTNYIRNGAIGGAAGLVLSMMIVMLLF